MIRVSPKGIFHGPNPFSTEAVVVADLSIDEETAAKRDRILAAIESAAGDWFAYDAAGGPTDPAESLADLIAKWSLAALNHVRGYLHDAGYQRIDERIFRTWISFHQPRISYTALNLAVRHANAAAEDGGEPRGLKPQLDRLWFSCRRLHPDYQARILMEAARADDIPCMPAWGVWGHWQYGWGARSRVMLESASVEDSYIAGLVIASKHWCKELLASLGCPTPAYALLNDKDEIPTALEKVGFPCVTKPLKLGGGKGVSAGLGTIEDVRSGFDYARRFSNGQIMLEAHVEGSDYRLTVIEGRVVNVVRRDPPVVVGDGRRTIRELVEEQNKHRSIEALVASGYLEPIVLDDAASQHLASVGLSLDTIPAAGQAISVRSNANVATGGSCTNVTDEVHPATRAMVETLARTLNARVMGFDYMTSDISRPSRERDGQFIELNLTPGLAALIFAGFSAVDTGRLALGSLPGRIPLDLIVVPDALLATAEQHLAALLPDVSFGLASHDKAWIGEAALQVRQTHPWSGVRAMLGNRVVERAYVLVASGEMQSHGLPVDRADRVWACADGLPDAWLNVLRMASRDALWQGGWNGFMQSFAIQAEPA